MKQRDFFANIASEDKQIKNKAELAEIKPIPFEKRYFGPSAQKAQVAGEPSYEEKLAQFGEDMQALRERYRSYLRDRSPEAAVHRKQLQLKEFQFRYEQKDSREFERVLDGTCDFETVTIPDYRGPFGRWTGFYRTEFEYHKPGNKRVFLRFLGVDYIANVYLNRRYIGSHTGFFAPFAFDITDDLESMNTLVVEVKNDAPTVGLNTSPARNHLIGLDGDKIYACTGPGWDDPALGWHHCPPGAGIYNHVIIEERTPCFVASAFIRPMIDTAEALATIEVENTQFSRKELALKLDVYPENFESETRPLHLDIQYMEAGPGINRYTYRLNMQGFTLWELDNPCMYKLRASLYDGETLVDQFDESFGMRKFHMDATDEPKGTFYLNNQEIILRGANTMGHEQQCVIRDDMEQLMDDILIAKLTNMNYYRLTQRPVQKEVYDYCDRLGLLTQTDLPLFGYARYNLFAEYVRQAGEMEKLIRNHPSSIMVTYINEPFPIHFSNKVHRDLTREEMEDFFEAATRMVHLENPDRVVKNVEGDYNPPTRDGLSDFHCYNMWYTNHALPIGRMMKGYIPPVKKGWNVGCGEYGTEGLDPLETMLEYYPVDWLPDDIEEPWMPNKIIDAQSYGMHGDWYEEQNKIADWIEKSQQHQAEATKYMTEAFRRRSDRIVSTAVHLLIDAFPSGWMKALVDYRRVPKPAYFTFQRALKPLRVNLRTDRYTAYSGELLEVEAWILNDTPQPLENARVVVTVRTDTEEFDSFACDAEVKACMPTYASSVKLKVPTVGNRGKFYLDATLTDRDGRAIDKERLTLEAFVKQAPAADDAKVIIMDDAGYFTQNKEAILQRVKNGARLLFAMDRFKDGEAVEIESVLYGAKEEHGVFFVARNQNDPRTREFGARDFYLWYSNEDDYITALCDRYIKTDNRELTELLFTYQKSERSVYDQEHKGHLPVFAGLKVGAGEILFSTIPLSKFKGTNPIFDRFLNNVLSAPMEGSDAQS